MPNLWAALVVSGAVAVGTTGLEAAAEGPAIASGRTAGWSIEPSPNPAGSTSAMLAGVSCSSSDSCTAVGDYLNSASDVLTLAEHWNGHQWRIETTPNAPNVNSNLLNAVSCAGPKSCTAVGYFVTGKSVVRALVEQWDGTTWSLVPTPLPSGAHSVELSGVSCSATDACEAVGEYLKNEISGQYQPLAEMWDGSIWTVQSTPNPLAENGSSLSTVSCTATDACTAGGNFAYDDVAQSIFAFRWNGMSWVSQHQPNPGGNDDNTSDGMSCPASNLCSMVGSWVNAADQVESLAEHWDGRGWDRQSTPNPSGAGSTGLSGVSCPGSLACTAVGVSSPAANPEESSTLAEYWNGTKWAIQATPNPPGAPISALDAVDCPSTATCVAVGEAWDGHVTATLAEAFSGLTTGHDARGDVVGARRSSVGGVRERRARR